MAAGSTYTPIATNTLGSATASVTFSSISGSYTDLVLVYDGTAATTAASLALRFNGDTATNYSYTYLVGNGTTAVSSRSSNNSEMYCSSGNTITTAQNNVIVNILNYSNATTYKTALFRTNNSGVESTDAVGLWRSTSAITSIIVKTQSANNFAIGSTFTLYGIAAA